MRTVWVPKNAKLKPTKVEEKSPKGQKQNKHTHKKNPQKNLPTYERKTI